MSQSLHQQLIRGIEGLNASQARQLQGLLERLRDTPDAAEQGDIEPIDADRFAEGDAAAAEAASDIAVQAQSDTVIEADATLVAAPPLGAGAAPDSGLEIEASVEHDNDLPQPVCAQEELPAKPTCGWGPPPLSAINFEQMQLIASLVREANEARNARRQRYGI